MRTVKLLPLMVLLCASATARAERRNPLEGQPAIRHRKEMRKLRFEFSPQFLTSINQDYKHAFGPGANLQFHLTDWLGIGVEGAYTLNANTAVEDAVRNTPLPASYAAGPPQPSLQIHDNHVLGIDFVASAYAAITPFSGKVSVFSALFMNYDLYGIGGVGFVDYKDKCSPTCPTPNGLPAGIDPAKDPNLQSGNFAGTKLGAMAGIGVHLFFNDWIGVQFELRDYIVKANPGGLDTDGNRILNGDDETIQNNLFFGAGLTLMLPPTAHISH